MLSGFEWDPAKREANLAKHGIDFVRAVEMFGSSVTEWEDPRREYGEVRMVAVGEARGMVLTVVSTWRGTNRRIISARRASDEEEAAYRAVRPTQTQGPD